MLGRDFSRGKALTAACYCKLLYSTFKLLVRIRMIPYMGLRGLPMPCASLDSKVPGVVFVS